LAGLSVLLGGRITPARSFVAGAILGADLAASLKTTMCLAALAVACAAVIVAMPEARMAVTRRPRGALTAAVLGFIALPLATILFFAQQGALAPFLYGTVGHNVLPIRTGPGLQVPSHFSAFIPICWIGARLSASTHSGWATPHRVAAHGDRLSRGARACGRSRQAGLPV
jgi:hypothetical protein